MKRLIRFMLTVGAVLLLHPLSAAVAQEQPYSLAWWTIDGGGGISVGDDYLLFGAAGQPDTGLMNGGPYTLAAGFWSESALPHLLPTVWFPLIVRVDPLADRVEDVSYDRLTAADPILVSGRLDPSVTNSAPQTPPDEIGEGAHDLLEETHWELSDYVTVQPGQTAQLAIAFAEPVQLQVRVLWSGSAQPVEVQIIKNGVTLATGHAYAVPPDHGIVTGAVEIASAGTATVQVRNSATVPVEIQIVAGALALSLQDQP
jgi:hypothetical protein